MEMVNYEVTSKFNVRLAIYVGVHLGCGILVCGFLWPQVLSRESVVRCSMVFLGELGSGGGTAAAATHEAKVDRHQQQQR